MTFADLLALPGSIKGEAAYPVPYSQDAWTSRLFSAKYMISWFGYATHLSQEASVYCQQQGRKQLAISWTIYPEAFPKVPSSSFEEWVAGDVGQCRLKASPHDKVVFPMNQLLHSADAKKTCDSKVACHDVDRNLMELPVFIKNQCFTLNPKVRKVYLLKKNEKRRDRRKKTWYPEFFGELWAYLRVYYVRYETYRFGDRCVSCVLSLKMILFFVSLRLDEVRPFW